MKKGRVLLFIVMICSLLIGCGVAEEKEPEKTTAEIVQDSIVAATFVEGNPPVLSQVLEFDASGTYESYIDTNGTKMGGSGTYTVSDTKIILTDGGGSYEASFILDGDVVTSITLNGYKYLRK